jgi:hypothetical protein
MFRDMSGDFRVVHDCSIADASGDALVSGQHTTYSSYPTMSRPNKHHQALPLHGRNKRLGRGIYPPRPRPR